MGVNSALFVLSFGISAWTGIAVTGYNFSTKAGASSCFKIFDLFSEDFRIRIFQNEKLNLSPNKMT